MKAFTVEWVDSVDLCDHNEHPTHEEGFAPMVPVVRLAEVDALIAQAVKFAEGYKGKLEKQHGALAYKYGQYVEVCAFLASVAAWRKGQGGCQVCNGAKGGVKGNENIIDNIVMCDYCHAEWRKRQEGTS